MRAISEETHSIETIWYIVNSGAYFVGPLIAPLFTEHSHAEGNNNNPWFFWGFCLFFWIIGVCVILYAKSYRYRFDEKGIYFKRGFISTFAIDIPYSRVQNIFIKVDNWLDNLLGITTLVIETASAGQRKNRFFSLSAQPRNRLEIMGLSTDNAEDIKRFVLEQIKDNPVKDGDSGL